MNNKRTKLLSVIAIILIALAVIGASYAYFTSQGGGSTSRNVSVTSNTTDNLSFQISNDISFRVTQAEFTSGGNNKSGEATASAILTPNNNTNSATMNYYMYLMMDSNPTVYSAANTGHSPELILQVFDSSNQLVTLTGLGNQVTAKGVTGYDITGKGGLITLLNNHQIVANNSSTIETWRVVITLINLDVDQNDNTGIEINGGVILAKSYCNDNIDDPGCNFSLSYNPSVTNTIYLTDGYIYHHDSTLENGANDGSWRYAGPNPNNYVCFGSDEATCPSENIYRIIGLIPVDVVIDSETNPITTEQHMLYKVVKHNYLTTNEYNNRACWSQKTTPFNGPSGNQPNGNVSGYIWTGSQGNSSNTWGNSILNINGLNGSYLTNLGSTWSSKIAIVMWKVGGTKLSGGNTMYDFYLKEIINSGIKPIDYNGTWVLPSDNKIDFDAKIGLIYFSDYGYGTLQNTWSYNPSVYNDSIVANNWLYRGVREWTITRTAFTNDFANLIFDGGKLASGTAIGCYAVRPTFYLTSDTVIDMTTHAGTISDPYRISSN